MKKHFLNQVVVITGSSSGIGKATARAMGQRGATVVINGRNPDKLRATERLLQAECERVVAVSADVASTEGAQHLINTALEECGKIDILINNAGMSSRGYFETLAPSVMDDMVRINLLGCLYPTRFALSALEKTQGSVVFISSVAGIRGLPETSLYCASKMALTSVAESLRVELSDKNIHVGIVYVGVTQNDPGKQVIGADGTLVTLQQRDESRAQTPETVATAVLKLIRRRKFKKVLTPLGKINAVANVLFPRLVDKLLIRSKERISRMNR